MDAEPRMYNINLTMILFGLSVLASRQFVNGLTCYVCESTSSSSSCIANPQTVEKCDMTYCTIFRRELREPAGILTAFYRGCENNPAYLNTDVETPFAKTYYRACNTNRCNTGQGFDELSIEQEARVDGDYILVPGIGSSQSSTSSISTSSMLAVILVLFTYAIVAYYE